MVLEQRCSQSCRAGHHEGDDGRSPLLARAPEHHAIEHVGMAAEHRLDLLTEHLLPAGVDRRRLASKKVDRAVGRTPRPIAWDDVADIVDVHEGRRGLHRVVEIAERNEPAAGEPADLGITGRQRAPAVHRQHRRARQRHVANVAVRLRGTSALPADRSRMPRCCRRPGAAAGVSAAASERCRSAQLHRSATWSNSRRSARRRLQRRRSPSANASPTTSTSLAPSRSTASSTDPASKAAPSSSNTTVPPTNIVANADHWAAP